MTWNTMLNPHKREESQEPKGKTTLDLYEERIDPKTGHMLVKKTGEKDFYQQIQSMKEAQELDNILKRYQVDITDQHITQLIDNEIDLTPVPKDLIEVYAVGNQLEKLYENTTASVKKQFGNFGNFLQAFQNGTLFDTLNTLASNNTKNVISAKKEANKAKIEGEKRQEQIENLQQQIDTLKNGGSNNE